MASAQRSVVCIGAASPIACLVLLASNFVLLLPTQTVAAHTTINDKYTISQQVVQLDKEGTQASVDFILSSNRVNRNVDWSKVNSPQDWKLAGLESASVHLDNYEERNAQYNSPRTGCPVDCKCGLLKGVTCYSPSDTARLPNDFPIDLQVLTLYGYKHIHQELQELRELQELSIYDGSLPQIPDLPPSLTHLRITNSKLQTVNNIDCLPHLQSLNIAHNNITGGDFSSLSHLMSVDLSNNPLEKVPRLPVSLTILKMININFDKQPTTWDAYLPNLRHLILTGLQVTQPPYLNLPKLEYLDLSYSSTKLLPYLTGLPNLKEINLSHMPVHHAVSGHFEGPDNLQKIDLSYTQLAKLPDKLFINNPNLKELYLHNSDIQYIKDYTLSGLRNLVKLIVRDNSRLLHIDDKSLSTLDSLKVLDISFTPIKALPFSLEHVNLTHLLSTNVSLICDCHAHWLPDYLTSILDRTNATGLHPVTCSDGSKMSVLKLREHLQSLQCSGPDIISPADVTLRRGDGKTALLECNSTGVPFPIIIWYSPSKQYYTYNNTAIHPWFSDKFKYMFSHVTDPSSEPPIDPRIQPLKSGQLLIQNMTRGDVGLYRCTAVNAVASVTSTTSLWLTVDELDAFKIETLLFGLACAMTFLLVTLIVQLIRYIMDRMGWECCCCRGRLSSKAQQVKRLLESVESYKSQQLDKLKDNYNSQVVSIKESCYQQMERLSESYSQQCKNLQSIKDYSAQQLTTARDQYVDQVNRVRDYSVSQMNKVSENYVFQRQRIRKFSAHQLFKLRETYKYQQKTLNKIMENIPDLYLQNCRTGGTCNRTDSMIFDDEIHGIDAYYRLDFLDPVMTSNEGSEDFYYTPSSTLTKGQGRYLVEHHKRQHSNASTNDYHEAAQSWATNTPNISPGNSPSHPLSSKRHAIKHTRSLSISSTKANPKNKGYVPSHRRTLSANINTSPPVKIHRSSPPLVEKTYWTPLARSPSTSDANVRDNILLSESITPHTKCPGEEQLSESDQVYPNLTKTTGIYVPLATLPQDASSEQCRELFRNIEHKLDSNLVKSEGANVNLGSNKSLTDLEKIKLVTIKCADASSIGSDSDLAESDDANRINAHALSGNTSPQQAPCTPTGDSCPPAPQYASPIHKRDGSSGRKKSLSHEGSKELEGRCGLPPVDEDKEPSQTSAEMLE